MKKKTYIPGKPRNKKIVGITTGVSSAGGSLSSEQSALLSNLSSWWKVDENGNLYTEKNVYSHQGVSAYGAGAESDPVPSGYDMLLAWVDYDITKANWVISAALGKGLSDSVADHLTRIISLEAGGGGTSVAWGTLSSGYRQLTVGGVTYALATLAHTHSYAPISHTHTIAQVTGLQTALDGKAASAHTHTIANVTGLQTALDGKASSSHTHSIAQVTGLQTALDGLVTISTAQTITGAKTFSVALTASVKVVTPIIDLGNGWSIEAATGEIQIKQGTTIKARFTAGGFVGTAEVTAYS